MKTLILTITLLLAFSIGQAVAQHPVFRFHYVKFDAPTGRLHPYLNSNIHRPKDNNNQPNFIINKGQYNASERRAAPIVYDKDDNFLIVKHPGIMSKSPNGFFNK